MIGIELFVERMLFKTVAVAPDVDDSGVMQEPVVFRRGDDGAPKSSCQSPKLLYEVMIVERFS